MANDFEKWLQKQKKASTPSKPSLGGGGVFGFLRNDLKAQGKLDDKWRGGQKWQGEQLKDLSIKKYGRSYESKFNSVAKEIGVPEEEQLGFREWLGKQGSQNVPAFAQHNLTRNIKAQKTAQNKAKKDKARIEKSIVTKEPSVDEIRAERKKKQEAEKRDKKIKGSAAFLKGVIKATKGADEAKDRIGNFLKHGSNVNQQDSSKSGTLGLVNAAKEKAYEKVDGYDRFDERLANSQLLGLPQQKMMRDLKENPTPEKMAVYEKLYGDAGSGGQKTSDVIAELLGYASPGALGSLGIRAGAKVLGKEIGKGSLKKSAKEIAAEGALIGAGIGGGEVAIRESLNPEDTNWKQNLAHIGINTAAGALLDPAISLAVPAAKQLLRGTASDLAEGATKGQVDILTQILKREGVDPSAVDPLFNTGGRVPSSQAERILSGQVDTARNVQNPLGQLGELNPRVSQAQALRELTNAPKRAKLRSPEVQRATFDPDAPLESKLEYFRNPQNPITNNEIPHVMQMLDDLEMRNNAAKDRNSPQYQEASRMLSQTDDRFRILTGKHQDVYTRYNRDIVKQAEWDEVKALQDLYKPANRPDYYKFKVPAEFREDFRDVPKRFRSAQENAMHIDEAATAAGYDNIDEFINHLVQLDGALGKTRKSLEIPSNKDLANTGRILDELEAEMDSAVSKFLGTDGLDDVIDEVAGYMRPREATPADPFENIRTLFRSKDDLPSQKMDDPTELGALDDAQIDAMIQQQQAARQPKSQVMESPPLRPMPQGSPLGATARAIDPYEGTGMAVMPKTVDRVAQSVKKLPEENMKFQTNWNSSIQPAKELEKIVTKAVHDNKVEGIVELLPKGNKRSIAVADNFAKQVQGFSKSAAKAVRSYKKGYDPVFSILKEKKIPRATFDDYALSKHAVDIYENNAEKALRRSEIVDELERVEGMRVGETDAKKLAEIDKLESKMLDELDTLDLYKLPKDLTEERARHIVSQFENVDGMAEAHALFIKEQQRDLYSLYKSGQHTLAEIEAMMKAHPNYVSLKRNVPDSTNVFNYRSPKNSSTPIRSRGLGSEEYDILPPLDSAFTNRLETFNAVARNDAINTLEKWSKIEGLEGLITRISPNDPRFPKVAKNTLKGYKDGKEIYYEVPPFIREMMESQHSGIKDDLSLKTIRGIATAFKRGTTNWNPQFHVKSALRDTTQMLSNSRTNAHMLDMAAGFLDSFFGPQISKLTGGKFKSYREVYKDMGGDMVGFISQDMYSVHRMTESIRKGTLDGHTVLNPFKAAARTVEKFGATMEHGARLGEFRSAKKKGYSDEDAAFEAIDLLDYSDQGSISGKLNPYDPYLTATLRGNIRTVQAMRENFPKFAATGLTYVTAPTLLIYASRYAPTTNDVQRAKIENMPTWQKNTMWGIPVPNSDDILLMPKPFILGQMFANPIERVLDRTFVDAEKPIAQDIVDTVLDVKNVGMPPMTIAGLMTPLELIANKDFFTGFDIEDQGMRNKPAAERSSSYTSEVANKIGQVTGHEEIPEEVQLSPAKIDHVIKKAGGTLGRQGLDIFDNILAEKGTRPARPETAGQTLNPLGSLVYKDTSASGLYGRVMKQAKKDDAEWLKANPDKKHTKKVDRPKTAAQRAYAEMKELNDEIAAIRDDMRYTAKEKKEMIAELRTKQKLIGSEYLRK